MFCGSVAVKVANISSVSCFLVCTVLSSHYHISLNEIADTRLSLKIQDQTCQVRPLRFVRLAEPDWSLVVSYNYFQL
jgi:hypothetical protein